MGRVIILEGPDGSGKTTLARELEKGGFKYEHEGPTPDNVNAFKYYLRTLLIALDQEQPVVFDRFHLGAWVYGPLLRNRVELTDDELTLLDRLMLSRDVRLILCLPGLDRARRNWAFNRKNELFSDAEIFKKSYQKFASLKRRYINKKPRVVPWSWHVIHAFLTEFQELPALPAGVVGSLKGRYLFIGEQAMTGYPDLPFMTPENSSGFLNRALREAGFNERDLILANALNAEGDSNRELIYHLVSSLRPLKVIALGKVAYDLVRDVAPMRLVRHVPHPQYMKRFGGTSGFINYVKFLKEARG